MTKIGIIDYGAGNLRSVKKAFDFLGFHPMILRDPSEMDTAERLVLPGVGAFGHAAEGLSRCGWKKPLTEWMENGRPFLGICLGLQLLFLSSEESPQTQGLGLLKGESRRFTTHKVPHMGWNTLSASRESPLFTGIESGAHFYFVHSYYVASCPDKSILATTCYGGHFISAAWMGRSYGVQFHPEKSGDSGLQLLQNWVERC